MDKEILDFIKKNQKVTIPQIQKEFSLSYSEVIAALDSIVKIAPVIYDGENYYVYSNQTEKVDIDSLEEKRQHLIDRLNKLLDEEGEEDDEDDEDEDNDEDDDDNDWFDRLFDDEGEEENEDEEELPQIINGEKVDVNLIDMKMNEKPIDLYRMLLLKNIKNGLKVEQKGNRLFIRTFTDDGISFELINDDGNAVLTDNGITFKKLEEKKIFVNNAIMQAIDAILSDHNIIRQGEVLSAAVDKDNVFIRFCEFFVAVQRICALDMQKIEALVEKRKLDDFRFNMMEQLIKDNPKIKRTEAILYMKDKFTKIKDSQDYDEIIMYATAVKEFGMLSDAQFEQCRRQITGG